MAVADKNHKIRVKGKKTEEKYIKKNGEKGLKNAFFGL